MENIEEIVKEFVDYLLPELTPYEASIYLYMFRNSFLKDGTSQIQVGKRTIAGGFGKTSRGETPAYAQISKVLKKLEEKGCIRIGDANREGTFYEVILPKDIPLVANKMATFLNSNVEQDYFTDPDKRLELFEKDKWLCQYCGETVTPKNATLDHFIPQSKGGQSTKDNLRTCCFVCNSIKSGKTYEEAAPFLLKGIQQRRAKGI